MLAAARVGHLLDDQKAVSSANILVLVRVLSEKGKSLQ